MFVLENLLTLDILLMHDVLMNFEKTFFNYFIVMCIYYICFRYIYAISFVSIGSRKDIYAVQSILHDNAHSIV